MNSGKQFSVVNFPKEKKVAVVATVWLSESYNKCAWPTGPGCEDKLEICATPENSWPKFPCSHLKFASKFYNYL